VRETVIARMSRALRSDLSHDPSIISSSSQSEDA